MRNSERSQPEVSTGTRRGASAILIFSKAPDSDRRSQPMPSGLLLERGLVQQFFAISRPGISHDFS